MGNTPSSEAPPRKPQKLSKPRVGNHAAAASASKTASTPTHARFSNSYLVGSLPAAVSEEQPPKPPASTSAAVGIAVATDRIERPLRTPRSGSRRNSKRWSGLFDFNASSSDQQVKRASIAGGVPISIQPAAVGPAQQEPLSRSLPYAECGPEGIENRGSARCNLSYEEFQRFILTHETIHEPVITPSESRSQIREVTESTWKSCHPLPPQPDNAPISRTNSQASLFTGTGVPVRRRSLIQTPGVATRSQEHSQMISSRSSFRNSLPLTPSLSQQDSRESLTTRRMSMPPPQVDLDPHVRVASPCDRSYQQVGGMKFGSLRVTNGMPESTPPPDDGTKAQQESHPELGYFAKPQPAMPGTSVPLNPAQEAEPAETTAPTVEMPGKLESQTETRDQSNDKQYSRNDAVEAGPSPKIGNRCTPATKSESDSLEKHEGTELLDITEDPSPNAKRERRKVQLELEHKTIKTLSGADSGVVPSPSSETSRKALSKADSGYSSNVSLRSFRSLKRLAGDDTQRPKEMLKSRIPERTSSMSAKSTQRPRVRRHDRSKSEVPPPPPPPPKDEAMPVPTRKSSLSSLARDTMNRIPTLRSSVSRDSRSRDSSSSRKKSSLTDRSITKADIGAPIPLAADAEGALDSKLQSPLEALRMRDLLVNGNDTSAHPLIPRKPLAGETRPESHRSNGSSQSHRVPSRGTPVQETMRSIPRVPVGRKEVPPKIDGEQTVDQDAEEIQPRSSPPRKRSLHSLSRSFSQAKASFKKAVPPITRSNTPRTGESEAARPEAITHQEAKTSEKGGVPRRLGDGISGRALNSASRDAGSLPLREEPLDGTHARAGRSNITPIKISKTEPNLLDPNWPLSPSVIPELAHLRKNKTPPPVSMRTRSLKNLRVPSPARSRSAPPADAPAIPQSPVARNRSRDSMHSHRSSPGTTQKTGKLSPIMDDQPGNKQEAEHSGSSRTSRHARSKSQPGRLRKHPQKDYHYHPLPGSPQAQPIQTGIAIPYPDLYRGRSPSHHRSRSEVQQSSPNWQLNHALGKQLPVPPVPPKPTTNLGPQDGNVNPGARSPSHSRHSSASSGNSPFRVLHSYNSPAYRGVPIWG